MKFEINIYLLSKMGWIKYSESRGITIQLPGSNMVIFDSDILVRFFITFPKKNICYVIKELSKKEKQKSNNLYKFIITDYNTFLPTFEVIEFNSNQEMFSMVLEYEACNDVYQRYFRINKLLNK